MPIRNVSLVHNNPNRSPNNHAFPIKKSLVERTADIALSEFAPAQDVLKDKKKLSSIGVAWYEKSNRYINAVDVPTSAMTEFVICPSCNILLEDNNATICKNCQSTKLFWAKGWQPSYYVTDFYDRTYDGNINSQPQSIIQSPTIDRSNDQQQWHSCRLESNTGTITRINTNNMEGFNFTKEMEGPLKGVYKQAISADKADCNAVLFSRQYTDFFKLSLAYIPYYFKEGRQDNNNLEAIRAAWISAAELIKMGIMHLEDIEPNELAAGIMQEKFDQQPQWSIFISDTLDNGAGYASKYANEMRFTQLYRFIQDRLGDQYLMVKSHQDACLSSCYRCLRNYENRFSHQHLDWRLALDLLAVMNGQYQKQIKFSAYWDSVLLKQVPTQLQRLLSQPLKIIDYQGRPVYRIANNTLIVPMHPFESRNHEQDILFSNMTNHYSGAIVVEMCPYTFMRKPFVEKQNILSRRKNQALVNP